MIELLLFMFVLLKDYNASVANKEGLQLATEGANVSYTMRLFAHFCSHQKRKAIHVFGVLAVDFLAKGAKS